MNAFDTLYANAEPNLRDALATFRQTYDEKSCDYRKHTWSYYDIGQADNPVILWLVGGLRMADAAFRSIPLMLEDFRIIAPSYAPVSSMVGIVDGLKAILKQEEIKRCAILAGSYGGMIAQVFIRRHPKTVNKLILSTTTVPNPAHRERYQLQYSMVEQSPEDVVMETAKTQTYSMINPPEHESKFWTAYLDELYSHRLRKGDLLSTYETIIDYMGNYQFQPEDLSAWRGEILILDSDNDAVFDAEARDEVNRLYPQAHSHTFKDAGHSPASTQREVYFDIVRKFLHE